MADPAQRPSSAGGRSAASSSPSIERDALFGRANGAIAAVTRFAVAAPAGLRRAYAAAVQRGADARYRLRIAGTGEGALVARNPRQKTTLRFERGVVSVEHGWRLGLRLARWGRRGHLVAAAAWTRQRVVNNRVDFRRGAMVREWYVNGPLGLEQGFDIDARPAPGDGASPLVLELAISGDLRAVAQGDEVLLRGATGTIEARYRELHVRDARGASLRARLIVGGAGTRIAIVVDDRRARYPLAIDPLVVTERGIRVDPAGDRFGSSLALDGDSAVVGAPFDSHNGKDSGSAYVFVRAGTSWSLQQKIAPSDGAAGDRFGYAVAISGDSIVVGAPESGLSMRSGAAYVFVRSGATWTRQHKVVPAAAAGPDAQLGYAVAIRGDTIALGAPEDELNASSRPGAVYVLVRAGTTWSMQQKLRASDGGHFDNFGYAVSLDTQTVLVGARENAHSTSSPILWAGAAYVFVRAGATWSEQAKLVAPDPRQSDYFGHAVALDGDTAVIGSPFDDDRGGQSGSVYVYTRSGASWTLQQKLSAADGAQSDFFGINVAVSGNTLVAGAYQDDDGGADSGSAYVFARSGGSWTLQQKLAPNTAAAQARFGNAVAVDGGTVVAGAFEDGLLGSKAGAAFAFVRGASSWSQQQRIDYSEGGSGDAFGHAVALDGNTAVVGAYAADDNGALSGCAYVFVYDGASWRFQQKLLPSDGAGNDRFGYSVALSGDIALVGADQYPFPTPVTKPGAAYVFVRTGNTWTQQQKLSASDGVAADRFGNAVAVDGNTALVGAVYDRNPPLLGPVGSAYVFARAGTSWSQQQKITVTGGFDQLGSSVALDGNTAVVGAIRAGGNAASSGAAFVYQRSASSWALSKKLAASDGGIDDEFGVSVAISGDVVIVGARMDDDRGADSGSVYVYTRTGSNWSEVKLVAADGAAGDHFGSSVAIDGVFAASGAPGDDGSMGAAYYFTLGVNGWEQRARLAASDGVSGDAFGSAVAAAPSVALVGAPLRGVGALAAVGSAYIFDLSFKRTLAPCFDDDDCVSKHCFIGKCCDTKCSGLCQSCATGTCVDIARGDPDSEDPQRCEAPSACDGAGKCKKQDGETCAADIDCANGHCADGRCCDTACEKTCERCDLTGKLGVCSATPAGGDPDKDCIGEHSDCGGVCDGNRGCDFPGIGTVCGTCKACDGTGRCTEKPDDDPACGVIDCNQLDSVCSDFHSLESDRCGAFGKCKVANDPATCTQLTRLPCADGGAAADGGPADGAQTNGDESGGCGCQTSSRSSRGSALVLTLMLLLLSRRRRSARRRG